MAFALKILRFHILSLILVAFAAFGAQAETFDPTALAAQIAALRLDGFGTPTEAEFAKDSYEYAQGLRSVVTFDENEPKSPVKITYWVFASPELMLSGSEDFILNLAKFYPFGDQGSDWGSYGYSGNEADAKEEHFDCANAHDKASKPVNANCGDFNEGRQTIVLGSLTWLDPSADVEPSLMYFRILPEVHAAVRALSKAEAALRVPPAAPAPVAGTIDPILVGNWETYVALGGRWSLFRLEINSAARYAFLQDGVAGHAGRFETKNGTWQMISETNGWRDFGTYQTPDATTFNMNSQLGPSTWRKVGP